MLSIDGLRKLAEMQEKLLRISINDRDVNLEKYKDIVRQIDEYYFSNLLSDIKQVGEHNQTLEEELEYLEQIISTYEQVLVEQVKFRNVCELYGDNNLELSDLSIIDKEYIDSRKNVISGYLISKKNIDDTKKELDLLSGNLRDEEIKNNELKKRLLGYEEVLRNSFISAEGRYLNGTKLEYVSVLSEYKKLGYDFKELLINNDKVKEILDDIYDEMKDANDKLKTAELCYEKIPSADSKAVLDEISLENTKVRYKLTMIKILELLSRTIDNYDMFLKKRIDLFDLIKYRLDYVKKLGISVSIDPFGRTKVFDQIKVVEVLDDNSKNIHRIRKSINELNGRLEEMISVMDSEKEEINNVRDIIIEREIITDVRNDDIASENVMEYLSDDIKNDEKIVFEAIRKGVDILDNQVIGVRDISDKLNMDIIGQKTGQVIKRVNEMVNKVPVNEDSRVDDVVPELIIEQVDVKDDIIEDNISLVRDKEDNSDDIVDAVTEKNDKEQVDEYAFEDGNYKDEDLSLLFKVSDDIDINSIFEDNSESKVENEEEKNDGVSEQQNDEIEVKIDVKKTDDSSVDMIVIDENLSDSDIFVNVDPFLEIPLFTDRTDDSDVFKDKVVIDNKDIELSVESLEDVENLSSSELDSQEELTSDEMPDAFWIIQDDENVINNIEDERSLSFDEQVELLTNNNYKKR